MADYLPILKTAPISTSKDELLTYDRSLSHNGSWTVYDKDAEVNIQFSAKGTASKQKSPPMILHELFVKAVKAHGNKPALFVETGVPPLVDGQPAPPPLEISKWKKWTYSEYYNECRAAAKAFIKYGFVAHDAVTVFGFNSPQWFMSQWAAQFAGGKVSGVYPSDSPDQVQYKALYSDSSIATCEGKKELDSFASTINHLPYLKAVVCWAYEPTANEKFLTRQDGTKVPVLTWNELISIGSKEPEDELNNRIKNQKPGHCCALVFTSGTTGNPKATMLSHDNVVFEIYSILYDGVQHVANEPVAERFMSYLPLSHIAGMMIDIICPLAAAAFKPAWGECYFARPYDLKAGSLGDRLRTVQPTVFLGVPRVWEKVAEKIQAIGAQNNAVVKAIGDFAKSKGLDFQMNRQIGGNGQKPFGYFIASRISSKIKEALGLQHCKFALSGAAPLALETQKYFASLGININEAYGMSECTGATTWSSESCHLWGSVGYGLPGMEVKIFKVDDKGNMTECPRAKDIYKPTEAEQGEVCFRGRHIMMGYLANPKLGEEHVHEMIKKNKEAIDENGWLHSGDKGAMSHHGMVRITGRFKELIKGAGGENIAPVPIEDEIKKLCPAISNVQMIGDKRKFNVCLVTLKTVGATGELPGTDQLDPVAQALCSPGVKTIQAAQKDQVLIKAIQDAIAATNKNGKVCPSPAAMVQKFTILPVDFSVVTGELTATLKLKRSVAEEKNIAIIDAMYEAKDTYVPHPSSVSGKSKL